MPDRGLEQHADPPPLDSPAVLREKLRLLTDNVGVSIASNLVLGLVLAGAFAQTEFLLPFIGIWLLLVIAVAICRLLIIKQFRRDPSALPDGVWLSRLTWASGAMGLVWGLTSFAMFVDLTSHQVMIGIMLLCGVCAGATVLNGAHRPAMAAFIGFALFPTALAFTIKGETMTLVMALTTCLFFIVVLRAGTAMEGSIRNSVLQSERNDKLIASQQASIDILKESRAEMRIIADYSYAWESWHDPEGRLVWVNRACERVTGYTPSECLEMPNYPLPIVHPDDREFVRKALEKAPEVVSEKDIEFRIVCKDGTIRWVAAASQPAVDTAGVTRGFRASARDVSDRKALEERLAHLADTDTLTGVFNRRKFLELMPREMYRAQRYGVPLCIAIFDLDHFKQVNDTHGHAAGDACLKAFVDLVLREVRQSDLLARFGGEEFVLMLPETRAAEAYALTDRLRKLTGDLEIAHGPETIRFTVSAGVTAADPTNSSLEDLLERADKALYEAKEAGRNRVVLADAPKAGAAALAAE